MKQANFVVITFDDTNKAIEASHKLQDMAFLGDIGMGYNMILRKADNGEIEVMKRENGQVDDTWNGMFIGMLVGMFMGPLGFLISTLAGTAIGAGIDSSDTRFENDFAEKVKAKLQEGKTAIVANVDETSELYINNAILPMGGQVFRSLETK